MNKKQQAELAKLEAAHKEAATRAEEAQAALAGAEGEEAIAAAQAVLDEAEKAAEATHQAIEDFKASISSAAAPVKKPAGGKSGVVTVTASANRRRAGLFFPKGEAVEIALDGLSPADLKALEADPVLKVEK